MAYLAHTRSVQQQGWFRLSIKKYARVLQKPFLYNESAGLSVVYGKATVLPAAPCLSYS